MSKQRSVRAAFVVLGAVLALGAAGAAEARVAVGLSIGVPGVVVGAPVYAAPQPYYAPPVYAPPQAAYYPPPPPVYVAPRPVYYAPPPPPLFYGPGYGRPWGGYRGGYHDRGYHGHR